MFTFTIGHPVAAVAKVAGSALVVAAIGGGLLMTATPAQAYPLSPQVPACTQWGFHGQMQLRGIPNSAGDSAWLVDLQASALPGRSPGFVPASVAFDQGGLVSGRVVDGEIVGNNLRLRIQYDDKPNNYWDFRGTVGDDGYAHGTEYLPGGGLPATWRSLQPFKCLDANQGVPQANDPTPAPAPTPTPTPAPLPPHDAITVDLNRVGLQVNVTVTNTATLPGQCTYVASPVGNPLLPTINRSFTIDANGTHQLTVPAPPVLSTYHVVVSCTGTFNGQSVEFGHIEKDISG